MEVIGIRFMDSKRSGQEDVHAEDIDRQAGRDLVASGVAGGLSDAAVIGEEGVGALPGEVLQIGGL